MKVKIGPYLKWWGPYQIAELVFGNPEKIYSGLSGEPLSWRVVWSDRLGEWLAKTWVADFCQWVHDKRQRQVYVHIDNYDVWNMDATLQHIIGPMFIKLKSVKQGSGMVDDEDVPEHLRSTSAPPVEHEWDTDANLHRRYDWLLDEMIWAFNTDHDAAKDAFYDHSQVKDGDSLSKQIMALKVDRAGLEAYEARLQNAYRLFGKYYQTFWD